MELVEIEKRTIRLELDPEDCMRLAQACETAATALGGSVVNTGIFRVVEHTDEAAVVQMLYDALASGFEAMAVAGAAWGYVHGRDQPDITLTGVRERMFREMELMRAMNASTATE